MRLVQRTPSLFADLLLFALTLAAAGVLWGAGGVEDALLGALFGALLALVLHPVAGALVADGRFTPGEAVGYGLLCLIVSTGLHVWLWREEASWLRVPLLAAGLWLATLVLVTLRLRLDRPPGARAPSTRAREPRRPTGPGSSGSSGSSGPRR